MSTIFLFGMPGMGEWVIIGLFVLIFFGAKKIPEFAKGLGKGIREFKDAANGIQKDVMQGTGGITNTIQEHIQEVKKEVDTLSDNK